MRFQTAAWWRDTRKHWRTVRRPLGSRPRSTNLNPGGNPSGNPGHGGHVTVRKKGADADSSGVFTTGGAGAGHAAESGAGGRGSDVSDAAIRRAELRGLAGVQGSEGSAPLPVFLQRWNMMILRAHEEAVGETELVWAADETSDTGATRRRRGGGRCGVWRALVWRGDCPADARRLDGRRL